MNINIISVACFVIWNILCLVAQLSGCAVNDVSPSACTLEPCSAGSHHHDVSVCCSPQPLKWRGCQNAPLSHMMGKVYSFHQDFIMGWGKLTFRWSMWTNSSFFASYSDLFGCLGNRSELHSWPVEKTNPQGWTGVEPWTSQTRAILDNEQLNYYLCYRLWLKPMTSVL